MFGPHVPPCQTPGPHKPDKAAAGRTRWVLPATILGSSVTFIDGSVVNVALPAIQSSLSTNLATMQWVINGYLLALASLILLGGAAADRFGRRRIFLIGLVGFAAASLACGLAPSTPWLIAARLAQGVAAALLAPASLAIIGATYTGEARGPAIGTWAAAGAITTALGPPLGGWLVDMVGWRSIFLVNLPIIAVALLFGSRLTADPGEKRSTPLDTSGALLAVLALGSLSYGLIADGEGNRMIGAVALAAAFPLAWLFVLHEARSPAPMMPLSLFHNRDFAGANFLTVLLYAALSGALFLLPFMLIEVHEYSTTAAGAAFLPFSVIMGLGSRWAGGLVERFGARSPLVIGPALTAAGYATLGISGDNPGYWTGFLPGLIIVGIGMTLCVAPLTTTVLNAAPSEESGTASGINNAAARAGGLVAVAALGLAAGSSGAASIAPANLSGAYQLVMFAAAALAGSSALAAGLTISGRTNG